MGFKYSCRHRKLNVLGGLLLLSSLGFSNAQASSLKAVAKTLAKGILGLKNKRVAVLSFPYNEGTTSSGSSIVAEHLTTLLVERKGVQVVERSLIHKVLSEMKLENSGAIDPSSTQKIGSMLGVDAIVTGTLLDLDNNETEVNARLIETQTGAILAAATTRVDRTWKDMPSRPPEASQSSEDETSHLHMSELIPTHPVRRRRPPPPPAD
jgi:TolB-like protein